MRLIALALLGALVACGGKSQTCTITDEGDGTSTIACPGGTSLRVPTGDHGVCTFSDAPDGTRQILCSDGTAEKLLCYPDTDGKKVCRSIFPGGGSIHGKASLYGVGNVPGIVVRAGSVQTQTASDGSFALDGLDAAIYDVTFAYPGYGTSVRTNIPAVGLPWRMDPVTLYPGWQLDDVSPSWARLSPDENLLLTFKIYSRAVGALSIWDLNQRVATPLSYDAVAPVDPAFAADGSVVFVEASVDPPAVVIRAPDGTRRTHSGGTEARFFGKLVLFVDVAGRLATWDPAADSVTILDDGAGNVLSRVTDVVPGEALVYQPTEGMLWRLWSKPTGGVDFSDVTPVTAGGSVVGTSNNSFVSWTRNATKVSKEADRATDAFDLAPDGKSAWVFSLNELRLKPLNSDSVPPDASTRFAPCNLGGMPGTCLIQFSPDGSMLAFVDQGDPARGEGGSVLRVMDTRNFAVRAADPASAVNELIFAGADHHTIVYAAQTATGGSVRMLRPGQSGGVDVPGGPGFNLQASRNGADIVYGYAVQDPTSIGTQLRWFDVAQGKTPVVVWDHVSRDDFVISPSGQMVIYRAVSPGSDMPGEGEFRIFRANNNQPLRLGGAAGFVKPLLWPGDDDSFLEVQPSAAPSFFDAAQLKLLPLDDSSAQVLTFSRRHVVYQVTDSSGVRTGLYVVYLP